MAIVVALILLAGAMITPWGLAKSHGSAAMSALHHGESLDSIEGHGHSHEDDLPASVGIHVHHAGDHSHDHAHALPRPILRVLEGLGALRGSGAALASYLLFEPGFIAALLALGQADVQARADEILSFLSPTLEHPVR